MASISAVKNESLNKDNFDTWKIQMEALLIKSDTLSYVNGEKIKPEIIAGNAESIARARSWEIEDQKARSDLILSISPSELKQIKGCNTSRDLWLKLQEIYQSKGPARKATLLKRLTLQRMEESDDVREHLRVFFDTVDKLNEMDVDINRDLLSVMLLYSLPLSFENFRCAIESRDELPSPEVLRIKITEENDARKNDTRVVTTGAMLAKRQFPKRRSASGNDGQKSGNELRNKNRNKDNTFKYKCHRCRKIGHKAADCSEALNKKDSANKADELSLCATTVYNLAKEDVDSREMSHRDKWCIDSGCTAHLCKSATKFVDIADRSTGKLNLASNVTTEIKARGTVLINTRVQGKTKNVSVHDALHVPDLRTNLLSVAKITDKGFKVIFDQKSAVVVDERNDIVLQADRTNDLYYIREEENEYSANAKPGVRNEMKSPTMTWHRRMGHLNFRNLAECVKQETVRGIKIDELTEDNICETCIRGKMTKGPFTNSSRGKTELLEVIHSDLCGPMSVNSNGGARYFVTFIDDFSRWCETHFLKSKDQVLNAFKDFKSRAETFTGRKIKYLQSDNGTVYRNKLFDEFLKSNGIGRRLTVTYTPEQNGVAERRNRTLVQTARCLLMQSNLPRAFWAEAVNTANYIRNRCPSSSLDGRTAFELWNGYVPDVSHFKEFGSQVYTLVRSPNKEKFEPRSKKGIFVGYSDESKAYRIWLPEEKKIDIARDVKFLEDNKMFNKEEKKSQAEEPDITDKDEIEMPVISLNHRKYGDTLHEDDPEENDPVDQSDIESSCHEPLVDENDHIQNDYQETPQGTEPRRGRGRPKKMLTGLRGRPRKLFNLSKPPTEEQTQFAYMAEVSLQEAIRGPEAEEWYNAMASELKCIIQNDTWELVERPKNREVIGSRIILGNKYDSNGILKRRKARIVARGFSQLSGIDFHETFAPVARLSTIRTITALAAEYGMLIKQYDITTAYLNGQLEEEIFMEVPVMTEEVLEQIISTETRNSMIKTKATQMLSELRKENRVCLLKKALYGLRQAGRRWHMRCDEELKKFGLKNSLADPCLYYQGKGEDALLVTVYVDDILVASRNLEHIESLKKHLSGVFDIKDLGDVKHCLGIEFSWKKNGIAMYQSAYIKEMLHRFGMTESKPVATPIEPGIKLKRENQSRGNDKEDRPYKQLVGALMYLAVCTRPDIAHAISYLSQFCACNDESHWKAAKRVLRYLKGTIDVGIVFTRTSTPLMGYVDADWANCPDDRRSYTGYAFILGGSPVSWESRKQRTVALSSTEAEYMALSEAVKEAIYLKRMLSELGFYKLAEVNVYIDNNGARKLAENPVFHNRTKHIDVRHYFVREAIERERLIVSYTPTEDMAADMLTKGLAGPKLHKCIDLLGLSVVK